MGACGRHGHTQGLCASCSPACQLASLFTPAGPPAPIAGILAGKCATAHPAFSAKLSNQEAVEQRVVVDGKLVTSRWVGCALDGQTSRRADGAGGSVGRRPCNAGPGAGAAAAPAPPVMTHLTPPARPPAWLAALPGLHLPLTCPPLPGVGAGARAPRLSLLWRWCGRCMGRRR